MNPYLNLLRVLQNLRHRKRNLTSHVVHYMTTPDDRYMSPCPLVQLSYQLVRNFDVGIYQR